MACTIGIIGAGRVGSTIAYGLLENNLAARILLVDLNKEQCHGEELDLSDALAFSRTSSVKQVCFKDLETANIIIIAAGKAQSSAQENRNELIKTNQAIISDICHNLSNIPKSTIIILVTNPVDIITRVAMEALPNHPRNHIFGSGTWLDTQRLRRILGNTVNVAPESIQAFIIGEHGDNQIFAWQNATIGGIPLAAWNIEKNSLALIEEKTRSTVYEIIASKQATYFGIASCIVDICSAIIFDEHRILPLSWSQNPDEPPFSLPSIIGKDGIIKQYNLPLSEPEVNRLEESRKQLNATWFSISHKEDTGGITLR